MSERIEKLNALIGHEIASILEREIAINGLIITVVRAVASPTLEHATIFISVFPEGRIHEALEEIDYAIYDIQQQFNKRMKMRTVPKLQFKIDRTEEQASKIEEILKKVDN